MRSHCIFSSPMVAQLHDSNIRKGQTHILGMHKYCPPVLMPGSSDDDVL